MGEEREGLDGQDGRTAPGVTGILTVYAHPDDESFGPAAVLAGSAREGAAIHGVWLTRGEGGETHLEPPPSPEELARLREEDVRLAAAAIGYAGVELLDYPDGGLAALPAGELEAVIFAAIERHRPQIVLTFGPAGITRHPDHLAVHRATTTAFDRTLAVGLGVRELYYDAVPAERAAQMAITTEPDGQPNTLIDIGETLPVKLAAMRAHARHMKDARERLAQLEREPQPFTTLFRARPPVPAGMMVTGWLQERHGTTAG